MNVVPSFTSRSMFGVLISSLPRARIAAKVWSSAKRKSRLGRFPKSEQEAVGAMAAARAPKPVYLMNSRLVEGMFSPCPEPGATSKSTAEHAPLRRVRQDHVAQISQLDSAEPASQIPPRKPNVVLIMADELGYECVAANGGLNYSMPNLDALAAEGVRFTEC